MQCMPVIHDSDRVFELQVPIVIVGAGACGLSAALAARDLGVEVLLLERDPSPIGTTGMSTGLIPAAGTPEQTARGITDGPEIFAKDILRKSQYRADEKMVAALAETSAETVSWLRDDHGLPLTLVDGFTYPGHSVMRMYGSPNRSGTELMAGLQNAALGAGADLLTHATVRDLYVDDVQQVRGVSFERPDGQREDIGCEALVLACCGFAGNSELVQKYISEIAGGTFHGHPGNKGDAVTWGQALDARLGDMDAYQGHGGLAAGHGIPILWPIVMEGGFQVNKQGRRFSDESKGYSEQAVKVLAQPDQVAFTIFDERLHKLMLQFNDYQDALEAKAVVSAPTVEALAALLKIPADTFEQTFSDEQKAKAGGVCEFGRDFQGKPSLTAPFYAAKVTGALFHTQGGLEIDSQARVLRQSGEAFSNLYAGGGAARGVSGAGASGYIAGNGLLTATSLGKIAGRSAARHCISKEGSA